MTAPVRSDDLRRPFLIGVLGVALLFVLIGGLIAAYGTGADRAEGVVERWLTDVGDTTRKGVRADARARAEAVGDLRLAATLLPAVDTDGKAAFIDLEVGKARTAQERTLVPFRLHQRLGDRVGDALDGTVVLERPQQQWRIVAIEGPTPDLAVPSQGGRPAAEAPLSLFAGALGVGLLVTVAATVAVKAATPRDDPLDPVGS